MQLPELYLIVIAGIAAVSAAFLLARWPKGKDASLRRSNAQLSAGIEIREGELREALRNANRFEALAEERRTEIDRLNGDLSKLRSRLDHAAEERRKLTGTVSRLETRLEADRESSEERIRTLTELRSEMQAKFSEMATEALKRQGEQFSKSSLERLEATLTPLKEHVGHFEQELKNVHQETLRDRERLKSEIAQLSRRFRGDFAGGCCADARLEIRPAHPGRMGRDGS